MHEVLYMTYSRLLIKNLPYAYNKLTYCWLYPAATCRFRAACAPEDANNIYLLEPLSLILKVPTSAINSFEVHCKALNDFYAQNFEKVGSIIVSACVCMHLSNCLFKKNLKLGFCNLYMESSSKIADTYFFLSKLFPLVELCLF